MNNITNVVLDRDKETVSFDEGEVKGYSRLVGWLDGRGWTASEGKIYNDAINDYLKGVEHDGLSLENLSMRIESKPDQGKQPRYLKADGTDTIDKWAATRSHEVFREIMYAQVEKYNDRLGKKAPILEEVSKMADYMNRWVEYEKVWIDE